MSALELDVSLGVATGATRDALIRLADTYHETGEAWRPCCDAETTLSEWREALEGAAKSLESWADEHDCGDIPCPTYGDDCAWQRAGALRLEADELTGS